MFSTAEICEELRSLDDRSVAPMREVRRRASAGLADAEPDDVLTLADELVDELDETERWVGYEIVYHHRAAREALDRAWVERLGRGISGWISVDTFCRYVAGPAWMHGGIDDATVMAWTRSDDRWWRRAALVATVPLNLTAAGGSGDTGRTIPICAALVDDRDDMVVKAMSWALRQLSTWDAPAVEAFLADHDDRLAARVRREVRTKLATGRKTRSRAGG
jgi:3-methyladenine DNA glycosylase AlkD